jgi:hypothetical protein
VLPVAPLVGRGGRRAGMLALLAVSNVLSLGAPLGWLVLGGAGEAERALLAPHLFAVASQVFMELSCYRPATPPLVRLAVPVVFTALRLGLLVEFVGAAGGAVARAGAAATREQLAMQALAVANLAFWAVVMVYLIYAVAPRFLASVRAGAAAGRPRKTD